MAKLYNLARMTTTTTGSDVITLGTAVAGRLDFETAGVLDGETISYGIVEGNSSEVGRGVYGGSGSTLTRSVLNSTNGGSPIVLGGSAHVFITALAEDIHVPYMKCSDVKAQNTAGGTFTQDAWQTRVINTEDADTGGNMSIASNQITLAAGTYRCLISCPASNVQNHQAKLYNISDGEDEIIGTDEAIQAGSGTFVTTRSFIVGRFTIASEKVFEIQHYCVWTIATHGFGLVMNVGSEIYTIAEFWKEA